MASWVTRAKPVVRTTVRPSARNFSMASRAPGSGATSPPSTRSPYAFSKAAFARWALSSLPKRWRKTEIFDSPMVSRT